MNKVLLIDDDLNVRRVLRHHLCRMGCQVEETAGTEITVGRCETERYTLILLAVNVPVVQEASSILQHIRGLIPRFP
jgi:CheY-like chemotaxis protein